MDRLTEVDRRYAYHNGALIFESDNGDMIFRPFRGRWTVLEPVSDRDEAVEAARAWEEACS